MRESTHNLITTLWDQGAIKVLQVIFPVGSPADLPYICLILMSTSQQLVGRAPCAVATGYPPQPTADSLACTSSACACRSSSAAAQAQHIRRAASMTTVIRPHCAMLQCNNATIRCDMSQVRKRTVCA